MTFEHDQVIIATMTYPILEIAGILGTDISTLNNAIIDTLLTDSRSLVRPEGVLFFALRTPSNDGHRYIEDLYRRGVRNFVVEHLPDNAPDDANFLVVSNTLAALQRLAAFHRHRFDIPVIGITGSRGKTAVKEWLYQLLHNDYNIVRSPRSYNSQIGVPLSVWNIDNSTELAIIEAGISHADEMAALAEIIAPTMTVITNIGSEHNDGFHSIEEKCREKLSLARHSKSLIYNADNPVINNGIISLAYGCQEICWSRTDSDVPLFISSIIRHEHSTDIHYTSLLYTDSITIPFTGNNDIENAINCLAVLLSLHVSPELFKPRFARLSRVDTRIDVSEAANNCLLIHDTYTSDYVSLAAALDFINRRQTSLRSTTFILSDMLKDKNTDNSLYHRIAQLVHRCHVSRFIGIGPELSAHCDEFSAGNARFFGSVASFMKNMTPADFSNELILLKGSAEFDLTPICEMLEARQHETVLEVDLDALVHNFNFYRAHLKPNTKIVCMLKASGYGAGSYELAKTLQAQGADYIAVAAHDEGVDLREAGITMPIMVLNPKVVNYKTLFGYRLEPEIFSLDMCREIIGEAQKYGLIGYPVHIKIDSGMHRLGFLEDEMPELITLLRSQQAIRPVSIFSHLATADDPEKTDYARMQLRYFDRCCNLFIHAFDHPVLRHILNTDGILRFPESQYEMVRLGIGLYGIPTMLDASDSSLVPVSTLSSVIIQIREWEAGTCIGYGCRGKLARRSRIATIPIGYADGFNRRLGEGRGEVWINGSRVPTIGSICMDLFMADVTDADCQVGDKVEIFGSHITAAEVARHIDTIPYEVLTSVASRVKRIYYRE